MKIACSLMVLTLAVTASAQEGATMLPANYQIQFENAWVKITSVRYGPNEKLAGHTHTPNPSVYVYLNDGGPVIFRHVGGSAATRAATKAGAFRVYRGLVEVHEVENTSSAPSEFLRVELKTEGKDPATFRGKFERPPSPSATAVVHFDHGQARISRVWVMPGVPVEITAASEPVLIIALQEGAGFKPGQERWIPASSVVQLRHQAAAPLDFLRVDFKTRPSSSTEP